MMNREIEFRVRHIKEKRFMEDDLLQWPQLLNNIFSSWEWEYVFMQYTWLKDKNWTKIFEGDIVKCSKWCTHTIIYKQEYWWTYFWGMPAFYLSNMNDWYAWNWEEEVIWNVYENPELLTDNQ